MDIEVVSKVTLISLYSFFSLIRIVFYRRAKKAGYKTVIEEKRRYAIWLSIFICYEIFTFFLYILLPATLTWGSISLPLAFRLAGVGMGLLSLIGFIWIHQTLGNNLSVRIRIKESQNLVTNGPYRYVRHPMYTTFYVLHIAAFLLMANWFLGLTWIAGLTAVIILRVNREEAMLVSRFGEKYSCYVKKTGRFLPIIRLSNRSDRS
jgi:protein-S-isoprenylcysteine O-methyltransferase Ste14